MLNLSECARFLNLFEHAHLLNLSECARFLNLSECACFLNLFECAHFLNLFEHACFLNLFECALSLLYSVSHADMQGPGPDQSRQYISALAILFVAIFIGLPIWWKTTEVYRCPLPYKEISELAHQQVNVMAAVPNAIYQVC